MSTKRFRLTKASKILIGSGYGINWRSNFWRSEKWFY